MRHDAHRAYLAAGLAAVAVFSAVDSFALDLALYELIAWSAPAALLAGILVRRPRPALPWWLLAASQLAWAAGDSLYDALDVTGGVPFPGPPDVVYVLGYAVLGAALVALARTLARPADLGDVVDATLVALAGGVLAWPWIFEPQVEGGWTLAVLVSVAYPLFDIFFLALLARLFLQPGSRPVTVWLVGASIGLVLVSDLAYATPALTNAYDLGTWRDAGWLAGYVVIGAAGLHPSLGAEGRAERPSTTGIGRLVAVTSGLLALPTAALVDVLNGDFDAADALVYISVAFAGAALVVVRVRRLLAHADRLRLEAAQSERKFRSIFDSAGLGISIGLDGLMTETNEAYQRMLGYSAEELAEMHFVDVTHPDDRHITIRAEELEPGGRHTVEKRYLRRDGSTFWASVTVSYAADGDFGIGIVEDITERRQLEEELRQAQKMEAVGRLAGGVAHDFNNLLMAISGYAELARGRLPEGDRARRDIEEISRSAARAAELTQRLLAFGRRQVVRAELVDLNEAVSSASSLLLRLIGSDVELVSELAPVPAVSADPGQLEQIVVNLAVNARDAMPAGGRLTVATRALELAGEEAAGRELPPGRYVVLEVRDTGDGMDEKTRGRAFEPFFTTKGPGQGSGLGLSMVYGAVRQAGGAAEIGSAPGEGTVVRIFLPEAEGAAPARLPAQAAQADPEEHAAPAARILLVEDEPAVAAVVREVLEDAGYAVAHAVDGAQGLALAESAGPFDLLVTDLVMPHMNGPRLAEEVRALHPGTLVLYISGYPGEEVVARGLLAPGAPYLEKPFALGPFLEHVRRLLAVRPAAV